jgi:PAS domain-containing protein
MPTAPPIVKNLLARVAEDPQRVAALLDGRPVALLAFDVHRMIVAVDQSVERFFGYEHGLMQAMSLDMPLPERFRQPHAPPRIANADLTTAELPALRRDGSEVQTVWTFGLHPVPTSRL